WPKQTYALKTLLLIGQDCPCVGRLASPGDLFICAKDLFVEAKAPQATKTFEINQSFEPSARNRRPTAVGALKMREIYVCEFDSLDATEKAAIRATLIRCRVLAAKIANELRNKRPEQFVDKLLLADLYASLEHAARLLEQKRR